MLGKGPDEEIARRLKRIPDAVALRRLDRGIPVVPKPHVHPGAWTAEQDRLLGKVPDGQIARRLGRSLKAVIARRQALRIRKLDPPWHVWSRAEEKLLGRVTDQAMAARLWLKKRAVTHHRRRLGIAAL